MREAVHRVAVMHRDGAVAGASLDRDATGGVALLAGVDRVETPVAQLDHVHAALVDDEVGAHQIGSVLEQPGGAAALAGLFVGGGGEDEVATQPFAGLRAPRQAHESHGLRRQLVLHVERPAAPHVAVLHQAGERWLRPLRRLGRDHVQVAEHEQRRTSPGAGQPGDAVQQLGSLADQRRRDAVVAKVTLEDSSSGGRVSRRIAGIRLDQPREQADDLGLDGRGPHAMYGMQSPP